MVINVGSINPIKIRAVKNQLKSYDPKFQKSVVIGYEVPSLVSKQPMSIAETIKGATNRARHSFDRVTVCEYSFGIESGLAELPMHTGYFDFCCCVIYDGAHYWTGLGGFFQVPRILEPYIQSGSDLTEASVKVGLTNDPDLGKKEGLVGILTGGRITRLDYTEQAVGMALFHIVK